MGILDGLADTFGEEFIVVAGLMIPFLGILVPVFVLLLVQPSRPRTAAAAASPDEVAVSGREGAPLPDTAPAAGIADSQVSPVASELEWLCQQLRESDVFEALT